MSRITVSGSAKISVAAKPYVISLVQPKLKEEHVSCPPKQSSGIICGISSWKKIINVDRVKPGTHSLSNSAVIG